MATPPTRRRVAVCMSGGLRTFTAAYPTFAELVLDANSDQFDFDIFGNFLYVPGDAAEENALAKLQEMIPQLRSFSTLHGHLPPSPSPRRLGAERRGAARGLF